MNQGMIMGAVLAVVLLLLWLVAMLVRKGKGAGGAGKEVSARVREGLTVFTEQSLQLPSVEEILVFACEAAQSIFGINKVIVFERGEGDAWEARVPRKEELGKVPSKFSGVFGWFVHNPRNAPKGELGEARFGAMRRPLQGAMEHYKVDVFMPLVERGRLMAVVAIGLGRNPTASDRQAMRLFRLAATAACANVRLHHEAAHLVTLAREVDLASAVELSLAPAKMVGSSGAVAWAGHYQPAGETSSDFWTVYPLANGKVMVLIGDAVGQELAGAMVSAVAKSCADTLFGELPEGMDPGALLTSLNHSLYQPSRPAQTSCFALLLDPANGQAHYSNAGHVIPYHVRFGGGRAELGALPGSGPLLGDTEDVEFKSTSVPLGADDAFVLFTDGLLKSQNPQGQPFRERQLQRLLGAQASADPKAICSGIVQATSQHRGGTELVDDEALVVVRWHG